MKFAFKVDLETIALLVALMAIAGLLHFKWRYDECLTSATQSVGSVNENLLIQSELQIAQKDITNIPLQRFNGPITTSSDLLKEDALNIFILVSMKGCDTCREAELQRWGAKHNSAGRINVIPVIIDDMNLASDNERIKVSTEARSHVSQVPYFDTEQMFLATFSLGSKNTPLVLFVDGLGQVLHGYKGDSEFQQRSDSITSLIDYINFTKGTP